LSELDVHLGGPAVLLSASRGKLVARSSRSQYRDLVVRSLVSEHQVEADRRRSVASLPSIQRLRGTTSGYELESEVDVDARPTLSQDCKHKAGQIAQLSRIDKAVEEPHWQL
jgi:hypothetical protein